MQWWKKFGLGLGLALAAAGCNTTPVQDGMVTGAALGSAAGAIIGHQSGKQGEGALIGAGAGALLGALAGDQVARERGAYSAAPRRPKASTLPSNRRPAQAGHYETRVVTGPSGERYEERVWVPH